MKIRFNQYDYLSIYSLPETFAQINIPFDNPILEEADEQMIVNSVAKHILEIITKKMNGLNN